MKNNRTRHDIVPERNERDKVIDNIRHLYEQKCLDELDDEEKRAMRKAEGLLWVILSVAVAGAVSLAAYVYIQV